ncbi:MAG: 3-isopropylmalate dehydratase large subunit, partial [Proteobacteria bacterium]|nr:3-isopropylmalate dehydratase large subunit [Pseudomonadota bacterium]MBU1612727.1 3-isopropylmalate dehydratase large subunit [Pseudomonadota bacterium]
MAFTVAEKILQAHTDQEVTGAGQIVQCKVDMVLANDITAPLAIKAFKAMGATKVFDKDKVSLVCDHFTPNKDIDSAEQVKVVREFAEEMGVTHYYECGEVGVEHALLPEKGIVGPGDVVVGADSHTCTYGGLGAFATGMGSTDVGAAMALGETWFKVPPTIKVNITGRAPKYVGAKDYMLNLIGITGVSGALYKALEFTGTAVEALTVEGRMTMANMAIEAGGKVGLF